MTQRDFFSRLAWRRPWWGVLLSLTACGGGSGGSADGGQRPDPVVEDIPVAYIQRPLPVDDAGEPLYPNVFRPDEFTPGGELYLKARATAQAAVLNISRCAFEPSDACSADSDRIQNPDYTPESPNYDVKDVAVSEEGNRLLFALREPDATPDDDERPTWNIWEYDRQSKLLRRVIPSAFEREKGDDVTPRFLPDGTIIFSSNRQQRSKEILLDEGKPQFAAVTTQDAQLTAFNLHRVRADGTDIQQLTYHQSHDLYPQLMDDGRVLFMRWNQTRLSFYTLNPDGTDIQPYFGGDTLNPAPAQTVPRLLRPQLMPDGRIAAIHFQNSRQWGGNMVVVDGRTAAEGAITSLSLKPVDIAENYISASGRFASLSPLYDGTQRLLVSWSQCRLAETTTGQLHPCLPSLLTDGVAVEGYEEAPPFYGVWIYDLIQQTQLPVVLAEEGKVFSEVITLGAPPLCAPAACAAGEFETTPLDNLGLLQIRSVYDLDGQFDPMGAPVNSLEEMRHLPAEQRPAHFVRITKPVARISNEALDALELADNLYISRFGQMGGAQEIVGYAPIEPDGSVSVRVPADVALSLQIVDAQGRQISREHPTSLQLRTGEVLVCNGCHAPDSANPHGRRDLQAAPIVTSPLSDAIAALSVDVDPASRYDALPYATPEEIAAPASAACRENWHPLCRIVINYEYHIQPLWELERDPMTVMDPALTMNVTATRCVACHSPTDANGNLQVPAAQLNLLRTKENADSEMRAYRQLLRGDERQIQYLYEESLATLLPACEFEDRYDFIPACDVQLDDQGIPTCEGVANCPFELVSETTRELLLDAQGNPVPRMEPTNFLPPPMSRGGAHASRRFFSLFETTGSHAGFLNPAEFKLLSEWLDTGGRYYTNPFETAVSDN